MRFCVNAALPQALILQGAIEAFQVAVVVGFADPGMSMDDPDPFREMLGEFRPVVGLNALEFERCFGLRLPQEGDAVPGTNSRERLGECPAGEHID